MAGTEEKILFDGKEEGDYDLAKALGDIFPTISADQWIHVGYVHPTQSKDFVVVKCSCKCTCIVPYLSKCVCIEDIVIGTNHDFDVHPITPDGARLALDHFGFWVN